MTLSGVDASHYQGNPDWAAVAASGRAFAVLKATEGAAYPFTGWYHLHAPKVAAAGLVPGAYHFLRRSSDPATQARYFAATVGDFDGLLAMLDVETARDGSRPTYPQVRGFAAEFARLAPGHPLLIYTSLAYWHELGDPPGAELGPLWLAHYATSPGPPPGDWSAVTVWQHTSAGRVPGIAGAVDLDQFLAGDRAALVALTGPPLPPDPKEISRMLIVTNDRGQSLLNMGGTTVGMTATDRRSYRGAGIPESGLTDDGFRRHLALRADMPPAVRTAFVNKLMALGDEPLHRGAELLTDDDYAAIAADLPAELDD